MIRIVESKYLSSAVNQSSYPETNWNEFAFVGRSNVGKSSMINALTGRKLLAKIANKPGKTRLINFFEIRGKTEDTDFLFSLVDLPGYGYAKVSHSEREQWQKMIYTYFQKRQQLKGVVLLVDIRHDPDPKDAIMINMLKEMGIKFMIAATKCDKIPKTKIPAHLKTICNEYKLTDVFICEFSSTKKVGIEKVLNWIYD